MSGILVTLLLISLLLSNHALRRGFSVNFLYILNCLTILIALGSVAALFIK